jgi:hypothetical protein
MSRNVSTYKTSPSTENISGTEYMDKISTIKVISIPTACNIIPLDKILIA